MTILLRMDDKMNRQLTCQVQQEDSAAILSYELVNLGFINELDREKIATMIEDTLKSYFSKQPLLGAIKVSTSDNHHLRMPHSTGAIERSWMLAETDNYPVQVGDIPHYHQTLYGISEYDTASLKQRSSPQVVYLENTMIPIDPVENNNADTEPMEMEK